MSFNVLSLFDGISCGQIALNRAGIIYDKYFASEIDDFAISTTQRNYPNTIQLGDVMNVGENLPKIDLLMGGSPCTSFSYQGKMLNFNDPRGKLFFEFIRVLNLVKPKYFLYENVVMKKAYEDIITEYIGVEPILFDSNLVSAQNRPRKYWTNIKFELPNDRNIHLVDILDNKEMIYPSAIRGRRLNDNGVRVDHDKSIAYSQCLEVKNLSKSNCLTTVDKDNVLSSLPVGRYKDALKNKLPFRNYSIQEKCRLQTIPEDYFGNIPNNQITKLIGNGWTVDAIAHILSYMR